MAMFGNRSRREESHKKLDRFIRFLHLSFLPSHAPPPPPPPSKMRRQLGQAHSPAALLAALFCLRILPALAAAADSGNLEPPSAPTLEPLLAETERSGRVVTVRKDGNGDFRTITDAVKSIPSGNTARTVIKIGPGVYREKILVDQSRPYVTFYGQPGAMPTISFDGTAARYGTANSATVAVESSYFVASNVIFENTAPMPVDGVQGAQAVAMRISGDMAAFYNCKFYGYQDTLCDDTGRHFFKNCFIRGTVDFIFGNGRSIYQNCEIESVADNVAYITAQARSNPSDKSGFSFIHCNITGTGNAFLSRAWREMSRVVFSYTHMGRLIDPRGWDNKGVAGRNRTVYFGEYKCLGPGAVTDGRVKYARLLNDKQARPFLTMDFIQAQSWLLPPPAV
ncbi:unnamed protein product [Musa banksii]